ncbi:MAG TPA: SGNH/GDSL hydrolase family protein [Kiritimatiellia bacterium]|nr:SGNH/GDSL hydrolase family protein [Kiritimatiellia bacterium]HRZ12442.1 SGNH/GDSL hydrolase family protein [Kiritimatiellia bacterium]HSA17800.1 SGNH/GDSL hydrolase family protein [Kiritimatiellia bacterium]
MLKRAGLVLAGLLVALAFGEWVARWSGRAPEMTLITAGRFRLSPNPAIGYEPAPNFEHHGEKRLYFEFQGRSNNLGFRDRDHTLEKEPAVVRLVVLGDSLTMGLFVDRTDAVFTSVLEQSLAGRGKRVEVMNFGVSGYNTRQEVAMLIEKGLFYRPDVVVLAYCLNDVEEMNGGIMTKLRVEKKEHGGIERSMLSPWLARSALYRVVYSQWLSASAEKERKEQRMLLKQDTVESSLRLLRETAERNKFRVLVAAFPPRENRRSPERLRRITDLCASNGFEYLDLQPIFDERAARTGEKLMHDGWHPTTAGHRCAGEAIADGLVRRGLVP